jgi:hypothetical protein
VRLQRAQYAIDAKANSDSWLKRGRFSLSEESEVEQSPEVQNRNAVRAAETLGKREKAREVCRKKRTRDRKFDAPEINKSIEKTPLLTSASLQARHRIDPVHNGVRVAASAQIELGDGAHVVGAVHVIGALLPAAAGVVQLRRRQQ